MRWRQILSSSLSLVLILCLHLLPARRMFSCFPCVSMTHAPKGSFDAAINLLPNIRRLGLTPVPICRDAKWTLAEQILDPRAPHLERTLGSCR